MTQTEPLSSQVEDVATGEISARDLASKVFETMPLLGRTLRRERLDGTGDFQRIHMLKHLMGGPQTQAYLAESLQMNPPALSKLIDSLEQKELVTRAIDPEDRRRMVITLTSGGRDFQRRMRAQMMDSVKRTLKTLSPEERATLSAALDIVAKLIETGKADHREER
ncbi:MAG: MarR family transcriptional regulator [Actinomycetia bacterium]|nr:MarR family transcriptional regulator [Actinomycetes bacterium]